MCYLRFFACCDHPCWGGWEVVRNHWLVKILSMEQERRLKYAVPSIISQRQIREINGVFPVLNSSGLFIVETVNIINATVWLIMFNGSEINIQMPPYTVCGLNTEVKKCKTYTVCGLNTEVKKCKTHIVCGLNTEVKKCKTYTVWGVNTEAKKCQHILSVA